MAIEVACTCGAKFNVQDQWAGRRAKCRRCQAVLTIPSPGTPGPSEGPVANDSVGMTGQPPHSDAFSDLFSEELPPAATLPAGGTAAPSAKPAQQRRVSARTGTTSSRRRRITARSIVGLAIAVGLLFMSWLALSAVLKELRGNHGPGNRGPGQGQSTSQSSTVRRTRTIDDLIPAENVSQMVGGPGGERSIKGANGFIGDRRSQRKVTGVEYGVGEWNGRKTLTPFEPRLGTSRSPIYEHSKVVFARDGYAVGGIVVNADEIVHAVKLIFMRVKDDGQLDPSDSYTSDWLGHPSGRSEEEINGGGRQVVGFMIRRMAALDAIGLIYD